MHNTRPVFIVGSGRCGTRSIYKMLLGAPGLEIHHEYNCVQVQKQAALYYMQQSSEKKLKEFLQAVYGSAIAYSNESIWIDSSNKVSWIIESLYSLFPEAKFILLVRDGRKVVSSFYNKLAAEIYDDESVMAMKSWLLHKEDQLPPPIEKKYWWNIPQSGQRLSEDFPEYDQFQRVCYHWMNCNQEILNQLQNLPETAWMKTRLEDITQNVAQLKAVLDFMDIPFEQSYFDALQTPQNVFFPMDFQLSDQQLSTFEGICNPMMQQLGYAGEDIYEVQY